jgi:hypothetical protein
MVWLYFLTYLAAGAHLSVFQSGYYLPPCLLVQRRGNLRDNTLCKGPVPGFGGRGLGEVEGSERVDPVLDILHEFLQLFVHREIRQSATSNKYKFKKITLFAVVGFGSTPIPLLSIIPVGLYLLHKD